MNFQSKTMPGIFQEQVKKYGNRTCVKSRDSNGNFIDLSWNELNERVKKIAACLSSIGIKKHDRVSVFSDNRPEWWIADLAILSIGAVNVPVYSTNSSEETLYIFDHAEVRASFVGSEDQLDRVIEIMNRAPRLEKIIVFDQANTGDDVITFSDALAEGEKNINNEAFQQRINDISPDDLATIIYTSGTTGDPKGVMLTHNNFYSNVRQIMTDIHDYLDDRHILLSFLPLSHSLERTAGYYLPMSVGCTVAFSAGFATILDDFKKIRPTLLVSVPRLYEKIHAGILLRVNEATPVQKMLFRFASNTAKKNLRYACRDIPRRGPFALRYRIVNRVVFQKILEALGMDRLEYAVSGGGPLSISDAEFFIGMEIKILEGFGLTETTPVTNVNRPWFIKPGTVGPALTDTEIKIDNNGEILIKGPQVMKGYYNEPDATREAFTEDGFLRTGDQGIIDSDGFLSITGRIKDIIVTAGGKNIAPQNIENSLKASAFIEQVAVIGDRRKYLSALIVPAFDELRQWADRKGIKYSDNSGLVRHDEVIALIQTEINAMTEKFARVEQIRKFSLLENEWTVDTGEITPSLKIKRRVIDDNYTDVIESMYPEQ